MLLRTKPQPVEVVLELVYSQALYVTSVGRLLRDWLAEEYFLRKSVPVRRYTIAEEIITLVAVRVRLSMNRRCSTSILTATLGWMMPVDQVELAVELEHLNQVASGSPLLECLQTKDLASFLVAFAS